MAKRRKYIHLVDRPAPPITNWSELPVLLDIPMVCRVLGKKAETVRRLFITGELPGCKAGGEWRVRKDELMLALGYTPPEVERYGFGMSTAREAVTIVERRGKEERAYELA